MEIKITERAQEQMLKLLETQNKSNDVDSAVSLRLSIGLSGCKGLSYQMEYISEKRDGDEEISLGDDAVLYVDGNAAFMLEGIEVDYIHSPMSSGFVFTNPNARSQCGCGKSFSHDGVEGNDSGCCH